MSMNPEPAVPPRPRQNNMAVASIILGAMGMFCFGPLTLIPAVILAHIAYSRARKRPEEYGGEGVALAGLIVGYSGFVVFIFFFGIQMAILLPALARAREAAREASCANNQKMLALEMRIYAQENSGLYPPLSTTPNKLAPDGTFSDFVDDAGIMICPSDTSAPDRDFASTQAMVDDHSYFYLGYCVVDDASVADFAKAYRDTVAAGGNFEIDIRNFGEIGVPASTLFRLKQNIDVLEPLGFTPSRVPVLIERPEHHLPPGGNVVYLDGHVEHIPYPGRWPMTEETIAILEELAGPG